MNRQEAVTQLAQLCVLTTDKTIGVLLPSFADVKLFQKELVAKLDGVPDWLVKRPVQNYSIIKTDNGNQIRFLKSGHETRGMTFNAFYISSRLTEEQRSEYVFSYLTMPHQSIITFDDL